MTICPPIPSGMIGMVDMKYLAKNPANSILICEEWSGLARTASADPIPPALCDAVSEW